MFAKVTTLANKNKNAVELAQGCTHFCVLHVNKNCTWQMEDLLEDF